MPASLYASHPWHAHRPVMRSSHPSAPAAWAWSIGADPTRLNRHVAIKALPDAFAKDAERLRRNRWRRACGIGSLVVVLANGVAVARANPLPDPPPAPAVSTASLSRAIEREARELVRNGRDGVWRAHSTSQIPTSTRLKRCTSKQGMLIGAAVGAVAGGVFAAFVEEKGLGRVRSEVVLQFAAGGAGVGAFVGLAYCR